MYIHTCVYVHCKKKSKLQEQLLGKKKGVLRETYLMKGEVLERFAQGERSNMMRGAVPRKRRMEISGEAQQKRLFG